MRLNMEEYLSGVRKKLDGELSSIRVHVVIGNESCDLDSSVSALIYAFYLHSKNTDKDTLILPLMNIPNSQFRLRTETTHFFKKLNINTENLLFKDQIDLRALYSRDKLTLTLVDHNVLTGADVPYEDCVVEVIDHHVPERPETVRVKQKLDFVGSCCTLVAEELLNDKDFLFDEVTAELLYGTILVDTINRSPDAGKITQRDEAVLSKLEAIIPHIKGDNLFEELQTAKFDISDLLNMEILEKDLKMVTGTAMTIAMSSVTMEMKELLDRPSFNEDLNEFCRNQKCDVVVIMTLMNDSDGKPTRQIAVYSENRIFRDQIADTLDNSEDVDLELDLQDAPFDDISVFQQGNVKASRKKVMPILKSFLHGDITPDVSSKDFVSQHSVTASAAEGFSHFNVEGTDGNSDAQENRVTFTLDSIEGSIDEEANTAEKDSGNYKHFDSVQLDSPSHVGATNTVHVQQLSTGHDHDILISTGKGQEVQDTTQNPSSSVFLSSAHSSNLFDLGISDSELVDPFSSVEDSTKPDSSVNSPKESKLGQSTEMETKESNQPEGNSMEETETFRSDDSSTRNPFDVEIPVDTLENKTETNAQNENPFLMDDNIGESQVVNFQLDNFSDDNALSFESSDVKNVSFCESTNLNSVNLLDVTSSGHWPAQKSASLIVECDSKSQADDLAELEESELFDKILTPEAGNSGENSPFPLSGVTSPFINSYMGTPYHSRTTSDSGTGLPDIAVPPNSLMDRGFSASAADVNLPSFNSAEMVERIHKKKASLDAATDSDLLGIDSCREDHTTPYTPQNSYREESFFTQGMRENSLPDLPESDFLEKVQQKRDSLQVNLKSGELDEPSEVKPAAANPFADFLDASQTSVESKVPSTNPSVQLSTELSLEFDPFGPSEHVAGSDPGVPQSDSLGQDFLGDLSRHDIKTDEQSNVDIFDIFGASSTQVSENQPVTQTGLENLVDMDFETGSGNPFESNSNPFFETVPAQNLNPFNLDIETQGQNELNVENDSLNQPFVGNDLMIQPSNETNSNQSVISSNVDQSTLDAIHESANLEAANALSESLAQEIIHDAIESFPDVSNPQLASEMAQQQDVDWMEQGSGDSGIGSTGSPQGSKAQPRGKRLNSDFSVETEYLPSMDPLHGSLNITTNSSQTQSIETDADKEVVEGESFRRVSGDEPTPFALEENVSQNITTSHIDIPETIKEMIIADNIQSASMVCEEEPVTYDNNGAQEDLALDEKVNKLEDSAVQTEVETSKETVDTLNDTSIDNITENANRQYEETLTDFDENVASFVNDQPDVTVNTAEESTIINATDTFDETYPNTTDFDKETAPIEDYKGENNQEIYNEVRADAVEFVMKQPSEDDENEKVITEEPDQLKHENELSEINNKTLDDHLNEIPVSENSDYAIDKDLNDLDDDRNDIFETIDKPSEIGETETSFDEASGSCKSQGFNEDVLSLEEAGLNELEDVMFNMNSEPGQISELTSVIEDVKDGILKENFVTCALDMNVGLNRTEIEEQPGNLLDNTSIVTSDDGTIGKDLNGSEMHSKQKLDLSEFETASSPVDSQDQFQPEYVPDANIQELDSEINGEREDNNDVNRNDIFNNQSVVDISPSNNIVGQSDNLLDGFSPNTVNGAFEIEDSKNGEPDKSDNSLLDFNQFDTVSSPVDTNLQGKFETELISDNITNIGNSNELNKSDSMNVTALADLSMFDTVSSPVDGELQVQIEPELICDPNQIEANIVTEEKEEEHSSNEIFNDQSVLDLNPSNSNKGPLTGDSFDGFSSNPVNDVSITGDTNAGAAGNETPNDSPLLDFSQFETVSSPLDTDVPVQYQTDLLLEASEKESEIKMNTETGDVNKYEIPSDNPLVDFGVLETVSSPIDAHIPAQTDSGSLLFECKENFETNDSILDEVTGTEISEEIMEESGKPLADLGIFETSSSPVDTETPALFGTVDTDVKESNGKETSGDEPLSDFNVFETASSPVDTENEKDFGADLVSDPNRSEQESREMLTKGAESVEKLDDEYKKIEDDEDSCDVENDEDNDASEAQEDLEDTSFQESFDVGIDNEGFIDNINDINLDEISEDLTESKEEDAYVKTEMSKEPRVPEAESLANVEEPVEKGMDINAFEPDISEISIEKDSESMIEEELDEEEGQKGNEAIETDIVEGSLEAKRSDSDNSISSDASGSFPTTSESESELITVRENTVPLSHSAFDGPAFLEEELVDTETNMDEVNVPVKFHSEEDIETVDTYVEGPGINVETDVSKSLDLSDNESMDTFKKQQNDRDSFATKSQIEGTADFVETEVSQMKTDPNVTDLGQLPTESRFDIINQDVSETQTEDKMATEVYDKTEAQPSLFDENFPKEVEKVADNTTNNLVDNMMVINQPMTESSLTVESMSPAETPINEHASGFYEVNPELIAGNTADDLLTGSAYETNLGENETGFYEFNQDSESLVQSGVSTESPERENVIESYKMNAELLELAIEKDSNNCLTVQDEYSDASVSPAETPDTECAKGFYDINADNLEKAIERIDSLDLNNSLMVESTFSDDSSISPMETPELETAGGFDELGANLGNLSEFTYTGDSAQREIKSPLGPEDAPEINIELVETPKSSNDSFDSETELSYDRSNSKPIENERTFTEETENTEEFSNGDDKKPNEDELIDGGGIKENSNEDAQKCKGDIESEEYANIDAQRNNFNSDTEGKNIEKQLSMVDDENVEIEENMNEDKQIDVFGAVNEGDIKVVKDIGECDLGPEIKVEVTESLESDSSSEEGFDEMNAEIQGTMLQNIEIGNAFSPIESPSEEVFDIEYQINPMVHDLRQESVQSSEEDYVEQEAKPFERFHSSKEKEEKVEEMADILVETALGEAIDSYQEQYIKRNSLTKEQTDTVENTENDEAAKLENEVYFKVADALVDEALTSAIEIMQEKMLHEEEPFITSEIADAVGENSDSSDSEVSSTTTEGSYRIINSVDISPDREEVTSPDITETQSETLPEEVSNADITENQGDINNPEDSRLPEHEVVGNSDLSTEKEFVVEQSVSRTIEEPMASPLPDVVNNNYMNDENGNITEISDLTEGDVFGEIVSEKADQYVIEDNSYGEMDETKASVDKPKTLGRQETLIPDIVISTEATPPSSDENEYDPFKGNTEVQGVESVNGENEPRSDENEYDPFKGNTEVQGMESVNGENEPRSDENEYDPFKGNTEVQGVESVNGENEPRSDENEYDPFKGNTEVQGVESVNGENDIASETSTVSQLVNVDTEPFKQLIDSEEHHESEIEGTKMNEAPTEKVIDSDTLIHQESETFEITTTDANGIELEDEINEEEFNRNEQEYNIGAFDNQPELANEKVIENVEVETIEIAKQDEEMDAQDNYSLTETESVMINENQVLDKFDNLSEPEKSLENTSDQMERGNEDRIVHEVIEREEVSDENEYDPFKGNTEVQGVESDNGENEPSSDENENDPFKGNTEVQGMESVNGENEIASETSTVSQLVNVDIDPFKELIDSEEHHESDIEGTKMNEAPTEKVIDSDTLIHQESETFEITTTDANGIELEDEINEEEFNRNEQEYNIGAFDNQPELANEKVIENVVVEMIEIAKQDEEMDAQDNYSLTETESVMSNENQVLDKFDNLSEPEKNLENTSDQMERGNEDRIVHEVIEREEISENQVSNENIKEFIDEPTTKSNEENLPDIVSFDEIIPKQESEKLIQSVESDLSSSVISEESEVKTSDKESEVTEKVEEKRKKNGEAHKKNGKEMKVEAPHHNIKDLEGEKDEKKSVRSKGKGQSEYITRKEIFYTSAGRMSISIDSVVDPPSDSELGYSGGQDIIHEESNEVARVSHILARTGSVIHHADEVLSQGSEPIHSPIIEGLEIMQAGLVDIGANSDSDSDEDTLSNNSQPVDDDDETSEKHVVIEKVEPEKPKTSHEKVKMDDTQEWHEDPIPGMGAATQDYSSEESDTESDSEYTKPARPDSLLNGTKRKKISANNFLSPDSTDDLVAGVDDIPTPDDLETPSDIEGEGLEWEDDTPITPTSESKRFSEYRDDEAEREKYENTKFRKVEIAGKDYRVDMKVIEPYKKVLSHGGYYGDGLNAIILFCGCYLPDRGRSDYQYVMDNLFLYVISTLELLVAEDYMIVYFHGATPRRQMPSFGWLKRCYQMIDRRLRKNLKALLMVHPTLWLKTVAMMTKPFISSKFSSKLRFVKTLQELAKIVPMEYIYIPEPVSHTERMLQTDPDYLEKLDRELEKKGQIEPKKSRFSIFKRKK